MKAKDSFIRYRVGSFSAVNSVHIEQSSEEIWNRSIKYSWNETSHFMCCTIVRIWYNELSWHEKLQLEEVPKWLTD